MRKNNEINKGLVDAQSEEDRANILENTDATLIADAYCFSINELESTAKELDKCNRNIMKSYILEMQ